MEQTATKQSTEERKSFTLETHLTLLSSLRINKPSAPPSSSPLNLTLPTEVPSELHSASDPTSWSSLQYSYPYFAGEKPEA